MDSASFGRRFALHGAKCGRCNCAGRVALRAVEEYWQKASASPGKNCTVLRLEPKQPTDEPRYPPTHLPTPLAEYGYPEWVSHIRVLT